MANKIFFIMSLFGMSYFFSSPVSALTYEWPVFTDAKRTNTINGIYVKTTIVTITDPSVDDDISAVDYLNKKLLVPISSGQPAYLGVFYRYYTSNSSIPSAARDSNSSLIVTLDSTESFKSIAKRFSSRMASLSIISTDVTSTMNIDKGFCVSTAASNMWSGGWHTFLSYSWDGGVGDNGCISTPPVNNFCALVTPSVSFNYGYITTSDIATKKAMQTENIEVSCTADIIYNLRLLGAMKSIPLSNGMLANIKANESELGSEINGSKGINKITLTSTLSGTADSTGSFNGSGVLFVNYP